MPRRTSQPVGFSPGTAAAFLGAMAVVLLVMHLMAWGLDGQLPIETADKALQQFNLNSEQSVPAWFSSMLLLAAAGLLAWTAAIVRREGLPDRWRWTLLAGVFVVLSMDEAASFHEMMSAPMRNQYNPGGFFRYAWVMPGIAGCIVLAAFFFPLVRRLRARTRWLVVLAGVCYLGGALGCEMTSAWFLDRDGFYSVPYKVAATCEEMLEITGLIIFCYALMDQLLRLSRTDETSGEAGQAVFALQSPSGGSVPEQSRSGAFGPMKLSSTSAD